MTKTRNNNNIFQFAPNHKKIQIDSPYGVLWNVFLLYFFAHLHCNALRNWQDRMRLLGKREQRLLRLLSKVHILIKKRVY